MSETTLNILIALIAGPAGALVAAWLSRRKDSASITKSITEAAHNLVGDYEILAARLEKTEKELRAELEAMAAAVENLTGQVMKYRLALTITVMQLRMAGFEPMIDPSKIDTMSVDELRLVAEGASNAETRRRSQNERGLEE